MGERSTTRFPTAPFSSVFGGTLGAAVGAERSTTRCITAPYDMEIPGSNFDSIGRARGGGGSGGGAGGGALSSALPTLPLARLNGALKRSSNASPSRPHEPTDDIRVGSERAVALDGLEAIDYQPPSSSVINHLDSILKGQFGDMQDDGQPVRQEEQESMAVNLSTAAASSVATATVSDDHDKHQESNVLKDLVRQQSPFISRFVESQYLVAFLMVFTLYALFVPDFDLLVGNKQSRFDLSIVTTFVLFIFLVEVVLQSIGRKQYFLRAYFWLDLVACVTLLQDTWLMQEVFSTDSAFMAGRSSKLTRLFRLASRSSKVTRLNRLSRIARVASLMPRLGKALGRRVNQDDTEKVLTKKLRRVFLFLDEDMDGQIPKSAATSVLGKLKAASTPSAGNNLFASTASSLWRSASKSQRLPTTSAATTPTSHSQGFSSPASVTSQAWKPDEKEKEREKEKVEEMATGTEEPPKAPQAPTPRTGTKNSNREVKFVRTSVTMGKCDDEDVQEHTLISFEEFRRIMLEDADVAQRLRRSCRQHAQLANNMVNLTSRHSEHVAVKVALGVLLLLFVLNMVEPGVEDFAQERGLQFMASLMREKFPNATYLSPIPPLINEQVGVWMQGVGDNQYSKRVVYLDIEKRIYCNEITPDGPDCTQPAIFSGMRPSLERLDQEVRSSTYRKADLILVRIPDLSNADVTPEELNRQTTSVAVLYSRSSAQLEAGFSISTTVLVIIIILAGVTLLTKDMTFLSRSLLRPLRELADDMESIAQLQLAGVSTQEADPNAEATSEVRLIRRTFENMKRAIKSWGKYVPWPVVQILLRANVEANLQVKEAEVTVFFSDIAAFTTIVESLPPESSLLLLSRYFNDMTKIIDDAGGVVLEFIGDAVLCIYGAPLANEDHPAAGVAASLRMFSALRRMNEWCRARSLPEVKIRCGVHTGTVLVGNMGFHSRMKYGIVGEDSHIPSRLEEMNKTYGTSMLISHSTFLRLPAAKFMTRPIDLVRLRGTPGATTELVYEVASSGARRRGGHLLAETFELHSRAMDLYRGREFASAARKFEDVGQAILDTTGEADKASETLLNRCRVFAERPPPESWDGSAVAAVGKNELR